MPTLYSTVTAPTFSVSLAIGQRTINSTAAKYQIRFSSSDINSRAYYWFRLYDNTASTIIGSAIKKNPYNAGMQPNAIWTNNLAAGSLSVAAPASTTTHTIYFQVGRGSTKASFEPSSWTNLATYTVSVTGKRTYNIVYYDYAGSTFYSTTGVEDSNHTVYNPGTSIRGFDHWNTNSSDTGTSYSPGATRYVNGNLYFYAIGNPVPIIKIKINGVWKEGILKIKYNGVWKDADTFYIKVNDSWKEAD